MELSNSLMAAGVKLPVSIPKSQESSSPRTSLNLPASSENSKNNSARQDQTFTVNSADLVRKAEAVQSARIQRDNILDNAPLKSQQAISAYQQTIESAKQYEEGELVGIDLYV